MSVPKQSIEKLIDLMGDDFFSHEIGQEDLIRCKKELEIILQKYKKNRDIEETFEELCKKFNFFCGNTDLLYEEIGENDKNLTLFLNSLVD